MPPKRRTIREGRSRWMVKQSFWVAEDLLKLFRSLGPRHGPRMNGVLRAFMVARLSGMLQGDVLLESYRERWMGERKAAMAEIAARVEAERLR